ncbi:hypothetical protein NEDG_01412 [Nematocida displodere]|uniref:t-SNARE coiled-coil homology domain-containing protein n=1 Tax=Nematocida displodere TaxID=1805483 RepID=A0A177EEC0_9MICR|nr:hypothetical protein NEDG_01412 [Nematocida displodere]
MKKFLQSVYKANREIDEQKGVIEQMDGLTRKVSGASNEKEAGLLRDSLTQLRDEFIASVKATKTRIETLKKKSQATESHSQQHTQQQHIASLVERVKKLVEHFSTVQSEFGSEERHRLKSQYIIAKPTATKAEIEEVEYSEDAPSSFRVDASAKGKKHTLLHIATGIAQVTEMTEELNLLVHKTERDVDKVAVTTTETEVKAKKADKDLKKTLRYQKLARYAKIVCVTLAIFLLFLFFGGILIAVVFFVVMQVLNYQSSGSSTPSSDAGSTAPGLGANPAPTAAPGTAPTA